MTKTFKGLVFEPFKKGEVRELTKDMINEVIGEDYIISSYNGNESISSIQIRDGVYDSDLERHRGISGTFIIVNELDYNCFQDLSKKQISEIKKKLDDKPQYPSSSKYLQTFFEEKDLDLVIFYYERESGTVPIPNIEVIERLLASEDKSLLKKAEDILRKIDFVNGDVNHFLEHMGNGMADELDVICREDNIIIC